MSNIIIPILIGLIAGFFFDYLKGKTISFGDKTSRIIERIPDGAIWIRNILKKILLYLLTVFAQIFVTFHYVITNLVSFFLRRTFFGVIIVAIGYLVLWYSSVLLFPVSDPRFVSGIFKFFGFISPNDEVINNFISFSTSTVKWILPISLTFYYFTYREQKTASLSNISSKSKALFVFILFSVLVISLGTHISNVIGQQIEALPKESIIGLTNTTENTGRITIWLGFLVISAISGLIMVTNLIKYLNLRIMLNDTIETADFQLFILLFAKVRKQRNKTYEYLYICIESIYQLMCLSAEKNMDELFNKSFKNWMRTVAWLQQSPTIHFMDNSVMSEYLLKKDPEQYKNLHNLILKNHVSLIMTLYKNHKIEEADRCITALIQLNPRSNKLRPIYFTAWHELAILMFNTSDSVGLKSSLNALEKLTLEDVIPDFNGISMIYKDLLLRSVEKNDVKLITYIVFSMGKSLNIYINHNKSSIPENVRVNLIRKSIYKTKSKTQIRAIRNVIFILLQATMKSIELANYTSTGFLLKHIVTTHESDQLNNVFIRFRRNKAVKNPFLNSRKLYTNINVSYNFNESTIEYCILKMTILLYGQQKYIVEKNVDFGQKPLSLIDITGLKCNYLEYLFESIDSAKSKYGLLFLEGKKEVEEKTFMDRIKNEFRAKNNENPPQ